MIEHWDEDTLLKSVLNLLDDKQNGLIQSHLAVCGTCRARHTRLKMEIGAISDYNPPIDIEIPPLPKAKLISLKSLLKIAALLMIGFLSGYLVSEYSQPRPIQVSEQYFTAKIPVSAPATFVPCAPEDISVMTY